MRFKKPKGKSKGYLFPRSKKGFNDMVLLAGLFSILALASAIIPYMNSALDTRGSTFNANTNADEFRDNAENVSTFNAFSVLLTFLKFGLFDIGNTLNLPFWLDTIFAVMFYIFTITIARNIWVGGGA